MTISLSSNNIPCYNDNTTSLCLTIFQVRYIHKHCSQASLATSVSPPQLIGEGLPGPPQDPLVPWPQASQVLCPGLFPTLTTPILPKVGTAAWAPLKETVTFLPGQFTVPRNLLSVSWHAVFCLNSWPTLREIELTFSKRHQGLSFYFSLISMSRDPGSS